MKPGYKQTEVGVIPEDWEVVALSEIIERCFDYRGRTPKKLGMEWGGTILALSANNVVAGKIDREKDAYFGSEALYRAWMTHGDCERDDILMTTEAPLGNIASVPDDERYILSQRVILLRPKSHVSKRFLRHLMQASRFQSMLDSAATGSTAKGIKRTVLVTLSVVVPPTLPEQQAIAEALSDADALIESLEGLIAKKRQIKQGAMQELLTGKRRLPGFSGEWETRPLGQLADIRSGGTPATGRPEFWDGGVPWCTPTDITRLAGKYLATTERTISTLGLSSSSAELLPVGSVVMTSRATIGECALTRVPIATNQGFKNFVCGASCDAEFLYYRLHTETAGFIRLCGGSTFLEIGKRQLMEYAVEIPPSVGEQRAIAAVLSDLDSELEALETKVDKARAIKQGMMQELLTGRTRLVPAEVS